MSSVTIDLCLIRGSLPLFRTYLSCKEENNPQKYNQLLSYFANLLKYDFSDTAKNVSLCFGQTMSRNLLYVIKVVGSVKIPSERILKDEEGGLSKSCML